MGWTCTACGRGYATSLSYGRAGTCRTCWSGFSREEQEQRLAAHPTSTAAGTAAAGASAWAYFGAVVCLAWGVVQAAILMAAAAEAEAPASQALLALVDPLLTWGFRALALVLLGLVYDRIGELRVWRAATA